MSGNVGNNGTWSYSFSGTCSANQADILTTTPASAPSVATTNANDAYSKTIADGGSGNSRGLNCDGTWYNRRDAIDTRIINDIKNGTGGIIDSPTQVGGWITPATGTGCTDTDHDGMPDVWETAHGLNPNDASDGPKIAADGYTNLENYLNGTNPGPGESATPSPTPSVKPGDTNGDNKVDETDYTTWLGHYGQSTTGVTNGDFNTDGKVDGVDYVIWLNNYGK